MSTLGRGRSRLILGILVALLLSVLPSLQGCGTRSTYSTTVGQMLSDGDSGRRVVKVAGTVSTEPARTGAGTVFLITDKIDPAKQVAVVYSETELPSVKGDRGPSGYKGRLVIATGTFDGRILEATELIVKTYDTYGTP